MRFDSKLLNQKLWKLKTPIAEQAQQLIEASEFQRLESFSSMRLFKQSKMKHCLKLKFNKNATNYNFKTPGLLLEPSSTLIQN